MISAVNKATGEVIELPDESLEDIVNSWLIAMEYEKAAKALKDQLKKLVPSYVESDRSEEAGNYQFKISSVQRTTYDKSVLREVVDEDTFDVLTKVDKSAVDKYLKENIDTIGEAGTKLRKTMLAEGNPYEVIKLEKLSRDS